MILYQDDLTEQILDNNISHYQFRLADYNDLPQILAINNELEDMPWQEQKFDDVFANNVPILLIYNPDNEIMGYLVYLYCLEEVRILNLTIAKRFRANGFAFALIRRVIEIAITDSISYALLEVRVDNHRAINIYTNLGFRILCVRENYYIGSVIKDAYLMQLKL